MPHLRLTPDERDTLLAALPPDSSAADGIRNAKPIANYGRPGTYAFDAELTVADLEALLPIAQAHGLDAARIQFAIDLASRKRPARRGRRQPDFQYLVDEPRPSWRRR